MRFLRNPGPHAAQRAGSGIVQRGCVNAILHCTMALLLCNIVALSSAADGLASNCSERVINSSNEYGAEHEPTQHL